jgi:hypothetical protein
MSWITQEEGVINHHRDTDFGTQPVRVLHHMLAHMFQITNPTFFAELQEEIEQGRLNREIDIIYGEVSIRKPDGTFYTPRANGTSRKIELHETFLSYMWSCTYAIYVTFLETIDFPFHNRNAGYMVYPISQNNIDTANDMFDYARFLIADFEAWNKIEMPNPELLLAEKRTYVEQTNCFYTESIKFILCHEFTHLKFHIDEIDCDTSISSFLEYELEADNNAIDKIKAGLSYAPNALAQSHRLAVENGVIIGVLSMFFFKATTDAVQHPNTEDRLTNALERLDLIGNPEAWAIACVGLKFWDNQFEHNFDWDENPNNYQEQYYSIIEQIKERID